LSVCGSNDRAPIPFISRVYYFVTGGQTRSTIVSGIVCTPRMASPILSALDRSMSGANSCCDRPRRTDGDRGDDPFSLTMPMQMPKIGHVVASTGRIHNSRRQVVLPRRWNIDGRGRTNRLDHHISVSNGDEPVFLLTRFHRDFNG
jgi:hypothetical protein